MENNSFVREKFSDKIIFFGTIHSKNPINISLLIKEIKEFNPNVILIEGGFEKATFKFEEEAIKKGGEMGAVSFFARKNNIILLSNDPNQEDEIIFLEKELGKDFTILYFFLRNFSFYKKFRIHKSTLDELRSITKWKNFDFSIQNIQKIFFTIVKEEFNGNKDYSDYFNPTLSINKFNIVTRELNKFRDNFMIDKLKILAKENKKICIVKGSHHLLKNKNAIKRAIK